MGSGEENVQVHATQGEGNLEIPNLVEVSEPKLGTVMKRLKSNKPRKKVEQQHAQDEEVTDAEKVDALNEHVSEEQVAEESAPSKETHEEARDMDTICHTPKMGREYKAILREN